jgi:hypothetical protein
MQDQRILKPRFRLLVSYEGSATLRAIKVQAI